MQERPENIVTLGFSTAHTILGPLRVHAQVDDESCPTHHPTVALLSEKKSRNRCNVTVTLHLFLDDNS